MALNLFNRTINVSAHSNDEKHITVNGVFIDSVHELILTLTMNIDEMKIIEAAGEFRRRPHEDCAQTVNLVNNLVGLDLRQHIRKQVVHAVGEEKGCVHFEELALECIKVLNQARFTLVKLKLPDEEARALLTKKLMGGCYHFRRKDAEDSQSAAR